jgi:hypothetical protein
LHKILILDIYEQQQEMPKNVIPLEKSGTFTQNLAISVFVPCASTMSAKYNCSYGAGFSIGCQSIEFG